MKNVSLAAMKRIALPMVERDVDWQLILETVKNELNMDATEENQDIIMDAIGECEDEVAAKASSAQFDGLQQVRG
jgi:hypothetical protein